MRNFFVFIPSSYLLRFGDYKGEGPTDIEDHWGFVNPKNKEFAIEILNTFNIFSRYSGLKINKSKCGLAVFGAKNGVLEALLNVKDYKIE